MSRSLYGVVEVSEPGEFTERYPDAFTGVMALGNDSMLVRLLLDERNELPEYLSYEAIEDLAIEVAEPGNADWRPQSRLVQAALRLGTALGEERVTELLEEAASIQGLGDDQLAHPEEQETVGSPPLRGRASLTQARDWVETYGGRWLEHRADGSGLAVREDETGLVSHPTNLRSCGCLDLEDLERLQAQYRRFNLDEDGGEVAVAAGDPWPERVIGFAGHTDDGKTRLLVAADEGQPS